MPLPHAADVEVRHQWPPDFRPPASGHLALIQPWEFGSIPTAWVAPLQTVVDELWVPSEHVRRMYLDAGVDADRVEVVPNGVDLVALLAGWSGDGARRGAAALRFLFVGGAIARKGIDVLLSAYGEAFAGRDDVSLIVKDFGADGVYRGGDRAELLRMAAGRRSGPPAGRAPRPRRSPTTRSPRSTAPAMCSSIPTAARASRCRSWRRWPAGCRPW